MGVIDAPPFLRLLIKGRAKSIKQTKKVEFSQMAEINPQTLEANPGAAVANVPASEGGQNVVANTNNTPALTLEQINTITKHSYASLDEATKGLEHLVSFTGKKVESIADPAKVQELERSLKETQFYLDNPQYKNHRSFLAKFGDPSEAIKDPEISKALQAMSVANEGTTPSLQTNPRIAAPPAQAKEALEQAVETARNLGTGNWVEVLKAKGIDTGV